MTMYHGVYINLDRSRQRRIQLEQQLEKAGLSGRYSRFAAIEGDKISYGPDAAPGDAALGCTLSHLSVLNSHLDSPLHLHIIEDDAILHPAIGRVLESFVALGQQWDVLMTDIFLPPDVYLFKFLQRKYREAAISGSISFLDISPWDFAGATSYFVNKDSKEKLLQLMEHSFPRHTPYDLRMRSLAKGGMLKIYTCFPFFSTLSSSSRDSTIAGNFDHVHPLTEYRRSFYIEPELAEINDNLAQHNEVGPDLHTQIYLNLVQCLISSNHLPF